MPLQHVETAHDAGQQIVEVVGDATGELTHSFHLLRLAQLLLQLLLLGDVAPHGVDQLVFGAGGPVEDAIAAIAATQPRPEIGRALLAAQAAQGIEDLALIVGMDEFSELDAGQIGLTPSQQAGGGAVNRLHLAIGAADHHEVMADAPHPVTLAGAQFDLLLQLLARTGEDLPRIDDALDIGAGAEPLLDAALGVTHRLRPAEHPAVAPGAMPQAVFDVVGLAGAEAVVPDLPGALLVVRVEDVGPAFALRGAFRHSGEFVPAVVEIEVVSIGAGGPDHLVDGVDDGAQLRLVAGQLLSLTAMIADVDEQHRETIARQLVGAHLVPVFMLQVQQDVELGEFGIAVHEVDIGGQQVGFQLRQGLAQRPPQDLIQGDAGEGGEDRIDLQETEILHPASGIADRLGHVEALAHAVVQLLQPEIAFGDGGFVELALGDVVAHAQIAAAALAGHQLAAPTEPALLAGVGTANAVFEIVEGVVVRRRGQGSQAGDVVGMQLPDQLFQGIAAADR